MTRSFWISLTLSVTTCASAVWWQAAKARSLAQQLSDEQTKPALAGKSEQRVTDSPERPLSEENVERVLADMAEIRALHQDIGIPDDVSKIDFGAVESAYAEIFPDFLRSVEGLTTEELIAVAEGIPATGPKGLGGLPSLKKWLLHLAAERDPLRVYRDEALMAELSTSAVLEILGREDPAAALRRLPPMEKQTGMPNSSGRHVASILGDLELGVRIRSATRLLGTDLEMGLEVLSEVHDNYGFIPPGIGRPLGFTRLPPGAIPGLLEAMRRPEHAEIRGDLIEMVIMDTIFDGGVAAVADRMEEMELTEGEFDAAIDRMLGNAIMESQPEQVIDWMMAVRPGRVPALMVAWAELDVRAAVDRLNQLEPSPARDQAVAEFAKGASSIDPEGAAVWVNEIQDSELRVATLRSVVLRNPTPDNVRALIEQTPGDRQENLNGFLKKSLFGKRERDISFREELLGQMTAAELSAAFESLPNRRLSRTQKGIIREHFQATLEGLGHSAEEIDEMLPKSKNSKRNSNTQER